MWLEHKSNFKRIKKDQIIKEFGFIPLEKLNFIIVWEEVPQVMVFGVTLWISQEPNRSLSVEAGGLKNSKRHAAPLTYGSKIGICMVQPNM